MTSRFRLSVAQLGPIARVDSRASVIVRLLELMREAAAQGATFLVFPELALTTFFPRWLIEDDAELDSFYETDFPSTETMPLIEEAKRLGLAFCLGFAELAATGDDRCRFNTSVVVDRNGTIIGKYRKIHLPGHSDYEAFRPWQHLEKRYFEPGDLGFPVFEWQDARVGMFICNDRRWPETWRMLGLKGAQLIVGGYNTPTHDPAGPQHDHLAAFHHLLSMQAGAYQNGAWAAAAAKAGTEEGCPLLGESCIVAPTGEIVARAATLEDEIVSATVDLRLCADIRRNIFNFERHRQPHNYGAIGAAQPRGKDIA